MRNVRVDPRIDDESRRRYLLRGYEVLSLLLAPIHDSQGRVVGLVELVNKVELVGSGNGGDAPMAAPTPVAAPPPSSGGGGGDDDGGGGGGGSGGGGRLKRRNSVNGFTEDDVRLLRMLCTHCSIYLRHLDTGD